MVGVGFKQLTSSCLQVLSLLLATTVTQGHAEQDFIYSTATVHPSARIELFDSLGHSAFTTHGEQKSTQYQRLCCSNTMLLFTSYTGFV